MQHTQDFLDSATKYLLGSVLIRMQTATITFKKTLLLTSSWYFMTIAPSHFHGPGRTRLTRDDNDPATYDDKEVMWNRLRLCPCTWKRPPVNASK